MAVQKVKRHGHVMWRARVVIAGKQQARFRATKREAEEAEAELRGIAEPAAAAAVARTSTEVSTLAAFADGYLKHCNTTNRPQYARKKKKILEVQLLPVFGSMRLDAIGTRAIDAYRSDRSNPTDPGHAVGPKWINETVAVLLHVLRTAQQWEIIERVPKIRPLKTAAPDFDFLSDDDADRLCAAARSDGPPWSTMILTALRTGLRIGELRGLRWRDADIVAGRIVVRVAADELGALHPPKSGKPREVPLGDDVLAALEGHRHLRTHVFDNADGSILTVGQCRKAMDRIWKRAGLRQLGWHVLRHTFASHLVMRGATLKAVQELGGWASMSMLLRYAHLSADARRDAVRLLDREPRGVTTGVTTEGRGSRSQR